MMHSLFFNTVHFLQKALPKAVPKTMRGTCVMTLKKIKQAVPAEGLYFAYYHLEYTILTVTINN